MCCACCKYFYFYLDLFDGAGCCLLVPPSGVVTVTLSVDDAQYCETHTSHNSKSSYTHIIQLQAKNVFKIIKWMNYFWKQRNRKCGQKKKCNATAYNYNSVRSLRIDKLWVKLIVVCLYSLLVCTLYSLVHSLAVCLMHNSFNVCYTNDEFCHRRHHHHHKLNNNEEKQKQNLWCMLH